MGWFVEPIFLAHTARDRQDACRECGTLNGQQDCPEPACFNNAAEKARMAALSAKKGERNA